MSPKSAKRSSPPFDRTQGLRINYNLPEIENRLEKFIYDVENESRLVRAGLKEKAETVKIYQKYKDLFSREVLEVVKNQIDQTRGSSSLFGGSSDSRRNREVRLEILERIYFTLVSGIIGFKTANLDDAIKTYFSKAKVKIDSEELAYFQLSPKIAKEPIFIKREKYDDSAEKVIVKINPKQLAVLQEEIRILKSLGFSGYLNYYSQAKKVDYADFFQIVQKIKKETDNLWEKTMSKVSQEIFGKPFKNIRACHLLYLRSMSLYDNFYPKEKVVAVFLEFTKGLGLFDLLSTVNIDDKNKFICKLNRLAASRILKRCFTKAGMLFMEPEFSSLCLLLSGIFQGLTHSLKLTLLFWRIWFLIPYGFPLFLMSAHIRQRGSKNTRILSI